MKKPLSVITLFCLLFVVGVPTMSVLAQDSLRYLIVGYDWRPRYLHFSDAMKMDMDSGIITFTKPVDSTAMTFARFVAENYSTYCDSLRREIRILRQQVTKKSRENEDDR